MFSESYFSKGKELSNWLSSFYNYLLRLININIGTWYMSGLYYRRWTRMYIHPAAKYFKQYGMIEPGM